MEKSVRSGLWLLIGLALLAAAAAVYAILLKPTWWNGLLALAGALTTVIGLYQLRADIGAFAQRRRGEIALYTVGALAALGAVAYLSTQLPWRVDMTSNSKYSLSDQSIKILKAIDKPVSITFFHDPMMRETVELFQQTVRQNPLFELTLIDPVRNPAQARAMNVQFAGTTLLKSEDRKLQISGFGETDITNAILRVSQIAKQRVCFLDGHGEGNPFSMESHDHMEGTAGHSHGLGQKLVIHEEHGMAKARSALENLGYGVEKVSLVRAGVDDPLTHCAVLVLAGPKSELLPAEVSTIRRFLTNGGNALFMIDPFVRTGLDPVLHDYSIKLEDDIIIDDTDHFWTDRSAPFVTEYNYHAIVRGLPMTFFPGARSLGPTEQRMPGSSVTPIISSSKQSYGQYELERTKFKDGVDKPGPRPLMAVAKRKPGVKADAAMTALLRLRGEQPGPDGKATATDSTGDGKPATDAPASDAAGGVANAAEADGKPSKIVVIGDSDFATNSFFQLMGNGKLFLNAVSYLAAQENLIGIEPRTYDIPRVNLTNRQMKGTLFLSLVLIPLLLAIIGTAVWWRQR